MSFSNYFENKILDHALGPAAYTKPAALYLGLYTASPGEDGSGPEVSGNGYARQSVAFGSASAGAVANTANIEFPAASASWGTISSFGVFDAPTGGNMLVYCASKDPCPIGTGDVLCVNAGALFFTLD